MFPFEWNKEVFDLNILIISSSTSDKLTSVQ